MICFLSMRVHVLTKILQAYIELGRQEGFTSSFCFFPETSQEEEMEQVETTEREKQRSRREDVQDGDVVAHTFVTGHTTGLLKVSGARGGTLQHIHL